MQKLATQAGIPYTDGQILEKGLTMIRSTRDFEYALTQWENKPQQDKTWANFKTHFHEAQLQLKKIRGPTMQQAGYHHANALAQELSNQLQQQFTQRDEQLLSVIQALPGLTPASSSSDSEDTPSIHAANSVSTDATQLEILRLLKELKTEIKRSNDQAKRMPSSDRQPKGPYPKTPDDCTRKRWVKKHYCWTHGLTNHTSDKCFFKAEGHQDAATMDNKMGGSKAYCS